MKITIEVGGYKVVAVRQARKKIWLVREYSGSQIVPVNTYATNWKTLTRTLSSLRKES